MSGRSGFSSRVSISSRQMASLAVADPRIRAAIFGGVFVYDAMLDAARQVTIPIEFLLPWDDEEIDRECGFALFDALGSKEKTLLAFPGSHFRVPTERIDTRFFARHLGRPMSTPPVSPERPHGTAVMPAARTSPHPVPPWRASGPGNRSSARGETPVSGLSHGTPDRQHDELRRKR